MFSRVVGDLVQKAKLPKILWRSRIQAVPTISNNLCPNWLGLVCTKTIWKVRHTPKCRQWQKASHTWLLSPPYGFSMCRWKNVTIAIYFAWYDAQLASGWNSEQKVCHAPTSRQWLKASRTWLSSSLSLPLLKMVSTAHWLRLLQTVAISKVRTEVIAMISVGLMLVIVLHWW